MKKAKIIKEVEFVVYSKLFGEGSGHDWYHIDRVRKLALHIASEDNVDLFLIELAALLHDIADWKFNNGDLEAGPNMAKQILDSLGVSNDLIIKVQNIIREVSFKGAGVHIRPNSLEACIVQDADRIDAIGAIGIARCFAYGGKADQLIYDPQQNTHMHSNFEDYKNSQSTSINHFYEKLLLLKDRMNTARGREIALERDLFLRNFLNQFFKEWNVE
ncbi:MAG: HD domain-containing protein [Bacteroidales bacterium]